MHFRPWNPRWTVPSSTALYLAPNCADEQELPALKAHIQHLIASGAEFRQIAILVRDNGQLTDIGMYLSRHHMPVHLASSGRFWKRREVRDCLLLLKFLLNPYDTVNLASLLRMPFFPCTDEDIARWQREASPLWETVKTSGHTAAALLGQFLENAKSAGYGAFISAIRQIGMLDSICITTQPARPKETFGNSSML